MPSAPPERFNFAHYVLALNEPRAEKVAYIDDAGHLTYGALAGRVRRFAAGLRELGIRREERVLLLMHDSNDWPIVFLGSLYAGVVPVAVNTLLTAAEYAYILEHPSAGGLCLRAVTARTAGGDEPMRARRPNDGRRPRRVRG